MSSFEARGLADAALSLPAFRRMWHGPLDRLESAVLVALDNGMPPEVVRAHVDWVIAEQQDGTDG